MPRGGFRANSGRHKKQEKYEQPVNDAEQKIVDKLPNIVDNLLYLANGGYEQITEEWVQACTVEVGRGANAKPAFPEAKPGEMILLKITKTIANKDRAANIYLYDRIAGKPIQEIVQIENEGNELDARPPRERLASLLTSLTPNRNKGETTS